MEELGSFTINDLLQQVTLAEKDYREFKQNLSFQKAKFVLSCDWKQINEERIELELPKITNQDGRNAYMNERFNDLEMELLQKEIGYHDIKRLYDTLTVGGYGLASESTTV